MDSITQWVPAITLHTGPMVVMMTMATAVMGMYSDLVVITGIEDVAGTEAGRDDGAVITEAMMVRAEGVEEAIMVVLVEVAEAVVEVAVEVAGRAVIADQQYSRH